MFKSEKKGSNLATLDLVELLVDVGSRSRVGRGARGTLENEGAEEGVVEALGAPHVSEVNADA